MIGSIAKNPIIGSEFVLRYCIEKLEIYIEGERVTTYGVTVEKVSENNQIIECKTIYDITTCSETAEEFLQLIKRNNVTPCTLFDVAEDFII